ncbi:hypothetical protein [Haloarcula onubensis]|uniref:Uncharacterized protein n=1 Tax=Haloarcula onubensis TaxID=2950539 RepID=A0ABU2FKX6_9EURY|nr:hypothetical protein [Halomicroarcula sp. S3CR25-11]MDS0281409.1 hypothetical protein [Halomicroarcula sp. S3CR25-11]
MSRRHLEQTLEPGTDREYHGSRVVYADSRAAVRSAVVEACAVVVLDAAMVREHPDAVRWLVTMTAETVVAVVGDVPEPLADLAETRLDAPVTESSVEALVDRHEDRRAYVDAVDRYYRAVERGASRRKLDAARAATDESAATLDAADRRAVLDAIGG